MARSSAERLSSNVKIASCADYNSDNGEEDVSSRKQANISVKRSGDLSGRENEDTVPPLVSPISKFTTTDLQSDSGYSSHTHLTNVSADTEFSVKSPLATASTTTGSVITASSSNMSDSALRSASTIRTKKPKKVCNDPNCTKPHGRSSRPRTTASPSTQTARPSSSSATRKSSPRRSARTSQPEPRPNLPSRSATAPTQRPPPSGYGPHPYSHPPPMMPHYGQDPRYQPHGHPPFVGPDPYFAHGHPHRPPMMHHATDMYGRPYSRGAPYGNPTIVQPGNPRAATPFSARRPRSPWHSEGEEDLDNVDLRAASMARQQARDQARDQAREQARDQALRQARAQAELDRLRLVRESVEYERQKRHHAEIVAAANAERMRIDALRSMPPPIRPASAMNGASHSRQPLRSPVLNYARSPTMPMGFEDPQMSDRLYGTSSSIRAPSPNGLFASELPRSRTPGARRKSTYADEEAYVANLEARQKALIIKERNLQNKEKAFERRERRRDSIAANDPDADLRPRMRRMSLGRDEHARETANINAAQDYINQTSGSSAPITAGILKNGDRKAAPSERSKRSGRSEHTTGDKSRRRSVMDTESEYQGGFKTRVDAKGEHEIEFGDTVIGLRPDGDGRIELSVAGKMMEKRYWSSKASSSIGSKLERRTSRRSQPAFQHDEDDGGESTERERHVRYGNGDNGKAPARRRAETHSGTAFSSSQAKASSSRAAERSSRGRVPTSKAPMVDYADSNNDEDSDDDDDQGYSSQDVEYSRSKAARQRHSTGYGKYVSGSSRSNQASSSSNRRRY